jgi:5-methylthioadenosine/S-adenosylhomocysteine deaminase
MVQGLSSSGIPNEGWLVHHTEYEKLENGQKATYQSVLQLNQAAQFQAAQTEMSAGSAFIYHLSEGSAPSLMGEFDALQTHGCVSPDLVAIHGTALQAEQFATWKQQAGSLVWSPLSNLWLYRATTDVAAAHAAGIRLCIGSDWSPSGSKHVLGELKVADLWNTTHLQGLFTAQQLCAMVTSNPADAIGLGKRLGRIVPGARADLLVMPPKQTDPYRNLIQCTERDTALVLVAGRPAYGSQALMTAAGAGNQQPIGAAGLDQVISLPNPTNPNAHLRWSQIVSRLQTLQQNPQAAPEALAAEPSSFRVILDMPGDEAPAPDLLAAAPPLTSVPPLDSLVHDAPFFDALQTAPIMNGLLNGLRQQYYPDV